MRKSKTQPANQPWTLTARWIVPIDRPPLMRGQVTIDRDRIMAMEPHDSRKVDLDLGDAIVLPGLVNAHTHLDLTGLRGHVTPTPDFPGWLTKVIAHRRSRSAEHVRLDIETGLAESIRTGTTLLGDISSGGASWTALAQAPIRSVVFYELLGLPKTRAHQAWAAACEWLRGRAKTSSCRPGLSPHAPYSVRHSLFRAAANLARQCQLPLAIHLAETRDELELLEHHSGSFAGFLQNVGVWDEVGLVREIDEIVKLNRDIDACQFVHGNYLRGFDRLTPKQTVVYCPRTHAAFGHEPYPLRQFLSSGVRIALGTDSLASSPDLDLLAEARFVRTQFPEIASDAILRMATLHGAESLGWQSETGSLTPGKSADLIVIKSLERNGTNPLDELLDCRNRVEMVLCQGVWLHGQP